MFVNPMYADWTVRELNIVRSYLQDLYFLPLRAHRTIIESRLVEIDVELVARGLAHETRTEPH